MYIPDYEFAVSEGKKPIQNRKLTLTPELGNNSLTGALCQNSEAV